MIDDWETLERVAAIVKELDANEGYPRIVALMDERGRAQLDADRVVRGVTAERVAELRGIVGSPRTSIVSREALRDALHFYDLVRTAWVGTQEEYNELYKRVNVVIREAAILISEGCDEEARAEWFGRREVKDALGGR